MEPRIVAAPVNCLPCIPLSPSFPLHSRKSTMAKSQQRSTKEVKKPKKDTSPPKPITGGIIEPVRTITTAVIPRGKLKNK